ncbi:methyltransferase domain [Yasminevirus sp. GU-2018]|uniref:Small RNA 2'-O-methyltransferase n=1 Tax=Yasminevirus sp. GU-2018 TaxID=2420051 RepID=A0A5K0U9Y2_9VIRU|nr:methyltransferase domain [Yasminevirus sp. GU-2018]
MGFTVVESSNEKLSFVIKKNPATAPHIKPVRKGYCIGWFFDKKTPDSNTTRYVTRFVDVGENVSFPKNRDDDYDYLPYMQYCAPALMTVVVKEMFSTVLNQGAPEDTVSACSFEQAVVKLSNRAVKLLEKLNTFVKNYEIKITQSKVGDRCIGMYNFKVSSNQSTISDLLKYVYLLGNVLNCMTFGFSEKPIDSSLDKIVKIINEINLPYYIRYTIKTHMIGKKEFLRVKSALEGDDKKIVMMQGNTQSQRFDFISKNVLNFCASAQKNRHIVDIGCGEGYYVKGILELLKSKKQSVVYHAHDIESTEMDKIDMLIKTDDDYANVIAYRSFDDLVDALNKLSPDAEIMIIFSEVIEHIPCAEVTNYVVDLINRIKFRKMIVTTPQAEFNVHYLLNPGEFRHLDHKQEFTKAQFTEIMTDILTKSVKIRDLDMEYTEIGDVVDGVSMSQGVVITSKHE